MNATRDIYMYIYMLNNTVFEGRGPERERGNDENKITRMIEWNLR